MCARPTRLALEDLVRQRLVVQPRLEVREEADARPLRVPRRRPRVVRRHDHVRQSPERRLRRERLLREAMDRSGGVKAEAARLLGLKPSALYYKLEKYGIEA